MTLPEELKQVTQEFGKKLEYPWPYWTPEKHAQNVAVLEAFAEEVCRKSLEAAARVCEQQANSGECKYRPNCHLLDAVEIRRSLLPPPPEQEENRG